MKQTENTDLLDSASISAAPRENGVGVRVVLVMLLGMTLVGAMRWALNVTNANARQISTNLTRLQGHYDTQAERENNGGRDNSFRSHPTLGPDYRAGNQIDSACSI